MIVAHRLGAEDVIRIASKLTVDDETFVIGGQAVNLWAWIYRDRHPYFSRNGPFTSQDIDYFGSAAAADRFAEAVGGVVRRPGGNDMNTPQTAIVQIDMGGHTITIDFLNAILGVARMILPRGSPSWRCLQRSTASLSRSKCRCCIPCFACRAGSVTC